MPKIYSAIILLGTLVAEGVWVYTAAAMVGLFVGAAVVPLHPIAVFGLLAVGAMVTRLLVYLSIEGGLLAAAQAVIGLFAIYAALAVVPAGFDFMWIARMFAGDHTTHSAIGVLVGFAASVYLWRFAVVVAMGYDIRQALLRAFRVGTLILAAGLLVEQASEADLGIGAMLAPFFLSVLVTLSVARLGSQSSFSKGWVKVVFAAIAGVLAAGAALGFLGHIIIRGSADAIKAVWLFLLDAAGWVLGLILEPFFQLLFAALEWLRNKFAAPPRGQDNRQRLEDVWSWVDQDAQVPFIETLIEILKIPVLLVGLFLLLWLLAKAFRGYKATQSPAIHEEREALDGDSAGEMARLLKSLLPGWLLRRRRDGVDWRYPKDEPGVTEIFKLYYSVLERALSRGGSPDPHLTPSERAPRIREIVPGVPVERLTACFNRACYGRHPTDARVVAALQKQIDGGPLRSDSER